MKVNRVGRYRLLFVALALVVCTPIIAHAQPWMGPRFGDVGRAIDRAVVDHDYIEGAWVTGQRDGLERIGDRPGFVVGRDEN